MKDLLGDPVLGEQGHSSQSDVEPPWGEANPIRGANYETLARLFLESFPLGTALSVREFDEWAHHRGLLNVPFDAPKRSDAWKAHLQRRHELRYRIRQCGTHPRMGPDAFSIDFVSQGRYEVRAPHHSAVQGALARKVESLVTTKRKQLNYLMQSADWSAIPMIDQALAESLYDDISGYERRVKLETGLLSEKFENLRVRLKRSVDRGHISPRNGGIAGLLTDESDAAYVIDENPDES